MESLEKMTYQQLRRMAIERDMNPNVKKDTLIRQLGGKYRIKHQLGSEGKDGKTFLAITDNGKQVAIKQFIHSKRPESIQREASFQSQASTVGISPKVFDVTENSIVMEKLDTTLYRAFCDQNGQLTDIQQKAIVVIFKKLDSIGIFHGDPNPLNFMCKGDKWYIIDFGFAKHITDSTKIRMGQTPNLTYMSSALVVKLCKINPIAKLEYLKRFCDLQKVAYVLENEPKKAKK